MTCFAVNHIILHMKKKTILMGMTNLGAAHKQSAVSISNAIREKYGDKYNIKIVDVLSEGKTLLDPLLKNTYRYFSNHFTFIYALFYYITNIPFIFNLMQNTLDRHTVKQISKLLERIKPDIILTTYPIFPIVFHKACKLIGVNIKIVALILDYETGHNSWLLFKKIDSFLISSEECFQKAISMGVPEEKIVRVGVPLSLKFSKKMAPQEIEKLRNELGCRKNDIMALIAGGGEGLGHARSIIKHIIKSKAAIHPVVVCGRNKALKKHLKEFISAYDTNTRIFGFVNNMYELMNAADIIISKGGYLTLNETFFLGKPLIIASYVPGQEKGNVRFARKNNSGYYIPRSGKLVEKIIYLSNHKEELDRLRNDVKKMGLKHGTREIADIIVNKIE